MVEPKQSLINELLLQLGEDSVLELTAIWALVITELYDCQWCGAFPKNWLFFQHQIESQPFRIAWHRMADLLVFDMVKAMKKNYSAHSKHRTESNQSNIP